MMMSILKGLKGVQCYLDDIIVYGKTLQQHDECFKRVKERLISYNVTLNDKCVECKDTIKFLGHVISNKGVQIDKSQLQALLDAPVPYDFNTLHSFFEVF
ncbi:Uncharacterised protein r2_g817 [Pycnogonum litorale]